jgi:hypothetical protein
VTASVVKLTAAAEDAVATCLPVLPIVGSDGRGYTVSKRIDGMVAATPEEWAAAALAIAELHAALYDLPSPTERLSASAGPYELEDGMRTSPEPGTVPLWVPIAIGIALAAVVIIAGLNL